MLVISRMGIVDGYWNGSKMISTFTVNGNKSTIVYEKAADRWKPRIANRHKRDTYYIGIESCVPSIEKESRSKTSYSMTAVQQAQNMNRILREVSNIMGRDYTDYSKSKCGARRYKMVSLSGGIGYTSLSMGAGEQRVFTILDTIFSAQDYSLILIDELDLTLHTIALQKLLDTMVKEANDRNLQIIFTTHREEVATRTDINIRHIWQPINENVTKCLTQTTPECLYRLNGMFKKEYEVYVEDDIAEAIVKSVLREENILDYVNVICFGDAANAFSVAAALHIRGQLSDNQLILLDGDVYTTDDEKLKVMKKRYSGNENGKDELRRAAISHIKQFNLPGGGHPEAFLWSLLKTKDGKLAEIANRINRNADDKHHYIYEVFTLQGESRAIFLKELIELLTSDVQWNNYVSEVRIWAKSRRAILGV